MASSDNVGNELLRVETATEATRWARFLEHSLDLLGVIVETGVVIAEEAIALDRLAATGCLTGHRIIGRMAE